MTSLKKPFVVYWNNIPSPYMVERFNALFDHGNLDFEAWFNDRVAADRSWEINESVWQFRYRYMPIQDLWGHKLHWPLPVLGRRPDVLVSWYAEPAYLVGWYIARLRGVKTCFRVLMTYDSWVRRHPVKEALKKFLFKRVDGVETVGKDGKAYAMRYGTPSERIFFATHTVDIKHFRSACQTASGERENLCRRLKVKGVVFTYVGRLWFGKGLKYLLDAFEQVQKLSNEEVSLLLVGDGQDEETLRRICNERHIRNVIFAGFRQKQELPLYYAISDVFVFPTLGDPYG
ncbi:MAG: glycosyltransferase, partial [Anaerolineaceae bacterium]